MAVGICQASCQRTCVHLTNFRGRRDLVQHKNSSLITPVVKDRPVGNNDESTTEDDDLSATSGGSQHNYDFYQQTESALGHSLQLS